MQAPRDQNREPTLLGVSSIDLSTPTTIAANPTTHAMLIDGASLYAGLDTRYLMLDASNDPITGSLTIQPTVDTLTALVVNDKDSNNVLTVDTINNRVGIGTTSPGAKLEVSGTVVGGTYNGQTISAAANFTGTLVAATSLSAPRLISTVANGTSPLQIGSSTLVTNLNADLLDGQSGAYYAPLGNISGTTNYVAKFTGANSVGNSLIYDNGTNVGIGTTGPAGLLHITSASFNPLIVERTGSIYAQGLQFRTSGSGSPGVKSGDQIVRFMAVGMLNTGSYPVSSSAQDAFTSYATENFTATAQGRDLRFFVVPNTTVFPIQALTILNSGNVGIGTTGPGSSLDIHNSSDKIGLQVQGFSTQTSDLQQWLSSVPTVLTHINGNGTLDIGIATGTAPLVITSTTVVTNLNADLHDGLHSTDLPNIKQVISLTAQTAAIGTTAITGTNTVGLYRVSYNLLDTTADLAAGTIMVNFAGTDEAGAFTQSSVALALTALGRTQGTLFLRISNTSSVSYSTSLVGLIGSSAYALYISVEKLL